MKLIIANWKMNLSISESSKYIKALKASRNEVVIAAPFTFFEELNKIAVNKKIKLAGQNVSQFEVGAYTGEVSAKMLKDAGCAYCLVGHSERRIYFQETDAQVNQKIKNLLSCKITPIICIGETAEERNSGLTKQVLKSQLKNALTGIKNASLVIAYEPVWAISTFQKGKNVKSAGLNDIVSAHNYIKSLLLGYKANFRVIYGGTVNPMNSQEILKLKQVDGALVGGASLKVSSFNDIIQNT
jgi:triosephosphate isomerase (TIM)